MHNLRRSRPPEPAPRARSASRRRRARRPLRHVFARLLAAEASGETAALVRSTLALTRLETPGGAGNVVPPTARARFNARLLPGAPRPARAGAAARARAASSCPPDAAVCRAPDRCAGGGPGPGRLCSSGPASLPAGCPESVPEGCLGACAGAPPGLAALLPSRAPLRGPGDGAMEPRLRAQVRAALGDDGAGARWRLTRLSGRPASGVAAPDGAAFRLVARAARETLADGQARAPRRPRVPADAARGRLRKSQGTP